VLRDTATEELADVPRMQRARLVALDRALALYASLSEDRRADVEVLAEGAELHASRAEVLADLGRTEESHAEYERALRFRERVHQLFPTPAHAVKLAAAKVAFGKSFTALFDMEAGLPHIEQGLELWREQRLDGESSEWANAQLALAEARFLIGRNEEAREAAEEARDLARSMQLARPDAPGPFWTLGRAEGWLSAIAERASEHELAREHGQASLAGFERASSLAPEERFYSFEIAEAQCDLADPLFELGELDAARSMLDSALARVDALLRDFPDSRRYRNLRSATLENLAVHAGRLGDPERALALQRDIVAERERDHRTLPERRDIAIRAAISQINLGASLSGLGHDLPAALAAYERAEALLAAWSTDMTSENEVSRPYVMARYGRALTLLRTGALDEAQRAIEAHSELVGDSAERLRYSADLWNELANAQAAAGRDNAPAVERLFELLGAAVGRGYADRNELETTPALDAFRADARFRAILARVPSD
jgi:tetratricopeptide (TPR) repeat protein